LIAAIPRIRPSRVVARSVGLTATALMAAALLAWTPQPATGWNQSSAEGTLWQLMNGARVNNGLRAVQQHGTLVSLARWRSQDMLDRNYFDHTVLGTGYQVYHWYDSNGLQYTWGGENIGWNNGVPDADSPVAIHEGFMASPGHRANILTPSWTHGGVGAYARDNISFLGQQRSPRMYTELFMQSASAPAPPPPPPAGGGGSGGVRAPSSGFIPAATPTPPTPKALSVNAPAAPKPSRPFDGSTAVAIATHAPGGALVRALKWDQPEGPTDGAAPVQVASSLRIEAPAAAQQGLVETVLGSLLGFFI
jgi:uncharacterized protein YkwD